MCNFYALCVFVLNYYYYCRTLAYWCMRFVTFISKQLLHLLQACFGNLTSDTRCSASLFKVKSVRAPLDHMAGIIILLKQIRNYDYTPLLQKYHIVSQIK